MFILRSITQKGQEANSIVGEHYSVVLKDENYEDFKDTFKVCFDTEYVSDTDPEADYPFAQCYGFVVTPKSTFPLYKAEYYYVMTGDGKTFANISYK